MIYLHTDVVTFDQKRFRMENKNIKKKKSYISEILNLFTVLN